MNRHHRTTIGINAQVLIGKAVAYTTDADYETFVANAVDGEFGIFKEDGTMIVTEMAEGTKFFAAVKMGDQIRKSTLAVRGADNVTFAPYEAAVKQVSHLGDNGTDGAIDATITAGESYGVTIKETTPGYEPFPVWNYSVTAVSGDTIATIIDKLVAYINDDTKPENTWNPRLVTAANVTDTGISFTCLEDGAHFEVIARGGFAGQQVRLTTAFNPGSGTPDWMLQLQKEGNVFAGTTTYNAQFAEDYGQPADVVDVTKGYDVYFIKNEKSIRSVGIPNTKDTEFSNIILAVPEADPSPADELALIFNGTALPE